MAKDDSGDEVDRSLDCLMDLTGVPLAGFRKEMWP
jgi:hypothetical protein